MVGERTFSREIPFCFMPLASSMHLQHCFGVRGSPLLRFSFMVLALILTGVGLMRVTSAGLKAPEKKAPLAQADLKISRHIPFQLLLSAPATEVKIDSGKGPLSFQSESSPLPGYLELDAQNPRLSLTVKWQNPPAPGEHRFAKLTLEAPGQATFQHVFDAAGDIDDFLELPLPTTR